MIIKTNSWHYKVLDAIDISPSKNLCIYFWQVIISIMLLIAVSLILSCIAAMIIYTILIYPIVGWWYPNIPLAFLSAILWMLIGFGLLKLKRNLIQFNRPDWDVCIIPEGTLSETPFSRVICAWIKAKKEKVCPKITFVQKL